MTRKGGVGNEKTINRKIGEIVHKKKINNKRNEQHAYTRVMNVGGGGGGNGSALVISRLNIILSYRAPEFNITAQ